MPISLWPVLHSGFSSIWSPRCRSIGRTDKRQPNKTFHRSSWRIFRPPRVTHMHLWLVLFENKLKLFYMKHTKCFRNSKSNQNIAQVRLSGKPVNSRQLWIVHFYRRLANQRADQCRLLLLTGMELYIYDINRFIFDMKNKLTNIRTFKTLLNIFNTFFSID